MNNSNHRNTSFLILFLLSFTFGVTGQELSVKSLPDSLAYPSVEKSSISGDALNQNYVGSITNALNGRVSGLFVTEGTGEPGNTTGSVSIRGYGTYNNRNINVYVDGFESSMSFLESVSPAQIESIRVLKDAGDLATFGLKGANGVLWVTTKRGKVGKTEIDFQFKTGVQQMNDIYKPLNSSDYNSLLNEAFSNDNGMIWTPGTTTSTSNVDWFDEVLKDQGGFTKGDLSFNGGSENARYYASFGYMNATGIYDVPTNDETSNAELNRYNMRINLDFNMLNFVEGKVDVGGIVDDRRSPNISEFQLWNNLANYPSGIYPIKNPSGTWTGTTTFPDNPVASVNATGYNSSHDRTMQGKLYLKEKLDVITEGLYIEQSVNYNFWARGNYNRTRNYARYIGDVVQTTDIDENFDISDDGGQLRNATRQFLGGIGYDRNFDKHELKASVNYLLQNISVDQDLNGAGGVHTNYNYENIGGVFNYLYNKKYMAQLGFAYSGSDNFEKGNRFGFFPSLALAWNISEESFLSDVGAVNSLKLRASAGKTGYDQTQFGRYLYMQYFSSNPSGQFLTGVSSLTGRNGRGLSRAPSVGISAEQSLKYDIGVDAHLFNKLSLSVDAFMDKRSDILTLDNTYSAILGLNLPPFLNVGEVTTQGIESILTYRNQAGSFNYSLSAMVLFSKNKIDYFAEVQLYENASATGNPIGSRFGFEADGFYDIDDFNADGSLKSELPFPTYGNVQPGDIKYKNIKEDGFINDADRVKIGAPSFPTATYALDLNMEFKGFDFEVMVQGVNGREINLLDQNNISLPFADNNNAYPLIKERWAYYPEQGIDTRAEANYPRLSAITNLNNYQYSSLWQKNGDYLKVRNIEIGYTLPGSLAQKIALSNVRIYLSAINLLSFSWLEDNYGIDPENMTGYPAMKSFTMGININL